MSVQQASSYPKSGLSNIYPCYFPGETRMPKNGISVFALASSTPLGNENGSPHLTDWEAEVKCFVVVCLRNSGAEMEAHSSIY